MQTVHGPIAATKFAPTDANTFHPLARCCALFIEKEETRLVYSDMLARR